MLDGFRPWLQRAQGWLLPPTCVLCLDPGQPPTRDLCAACEADLPRSPELAPPAAFDAALAPFAYDWPVDALIRDFKYHGRLAHGRVLGTLLADAAGAALSGGEPVPQALVPVPLHPRRERERGYNQAWELARVLGRELGIPVVANLVLRTRETPPQASLDAAARRTNLVGAFALRRAPGVERIALVDDVLTTGATLGELARVLRAAGAGRVTAWTVARATGGGAVQPGSVASAISSAGTPTRNATNSSSRMPM
jgi:ComF family protein